MVEVVDIYELSPLQQGMLFHALSAPGVGVDIEQIIITLREPLDVVRAHASKLSDGVDLNWLGARSRIGRSQSSPGPWRAS